MEKFSIEKLSAGEPIREVIYRGVTSPDAVTRETMLKMEDRAVEEFGIPRILLMENAARALVREVEDYSAFAIVCAPGGNGGDGLAAARHLCLMGRDVRVYIIGDIAKGSPEFVTNYGIMQKMAPEAMHPLTDENFKDFEHALRGCETCIDAIFGVGLSRPVEGMYRQAIEAMNKYAFHIVSVDVPSGVDANTGKVQGAAVRAHKTIALH